jgi:hypothetical protein
MRNEILEASRKHFIGHIEKHRINIEIMLAHPRAIMDHENLMDGIEKEIAHIAEYMDKLEVLDRYFSVKQ